MINYDTVATAVKDTILSDSYFSDDSNIRTLEVHERPFLLQGEDGAPSFKSEEMPAINAIVPAGASDEDLSTTQEVRRFIPGSLKIRSLHTDGQDGLTAHYLLVQNAERVLNSQKTSVKDLGIGAFVTNVSSETVRFKKESQTIIETTTSFIIDVTTTI